MNIYQLRDIIAQEVIDYNQLKHYLADYANPRAKISHWLHQGELIRVKKGLYVFGQAVRRETYSLENLSNLIYGPSAVSLNYALHYYGIIPERVYTVTAITNKRNKDFETPIGRFSYRYLSAEKYAVGIQLLKTKKGENFLIATPEKALCDLIALEAKGIVFKSKEDVENFLLADLRIDESSVRAFDRKLIEQIGELYHNRRLQKFIRYFMKWVS